MIVAFSCKLNGLFYNYCMNTFLENIDSHVLPRIFFEADPVAVAQKILGMYLVRYTQGIFLIGKIVETEAYLWTNDPASHSFKWKNERNKSVFGPAGHAYVHRQRHHTLLDIVTNKEHVPWAVLLRALEPVHGIPAMMDHRGTQQLHALTNGPAKLCQAMQITHALDGADLTAAEAWLCICRPDDYKELIWSSIQTSPRIGISQAKDLELRFYIKENAFVSK